MYNEPSFLQAVAGFDAQSLNVTTGLDSSPLNLSVSSSHSDEEAGLIRECFPNVDKPQVDTNVSAALNPGSTAGEEICTAILAGLQ